MRALPAKTAAQRARALRILRELRLAYPNAQCRLNWSQPHELLVATILSAQATDESVNAATPALFARFPTPAAYAAASAEEIQPFIRTIGLWRMKARAVFEAMRAVASIHAGQVPRTMAELTALRGVARKTANVVLGNCFHINEGVVVDTHVSRLAGRMSLSKHRDPQKIERDLMALFPQDAWCELSHLLIFHGRAVCRARGNICGSNALCREFCSEAKRLKTAKAARTPRTPRTLRKANSQSRSAT